MNDTMNTINNANSDSDFDFDMSILKGFSIETISSRNTFSFHCEAVNCEAPDSVISTWFPKSRMCKICKKGIHPFCASNSKDEYDGEYHYFHKGKCLSNNDEEVNSSNSLIQLKSNENEINEDGTETIDTDIFLL